MKIFRRFLSQFLWIFFLIPSLIYAEEFEELPLEKREILRSGKGRQGTCREWTNSSLDPPLKEWDCAELPVQKPTEPLALGNFSLPTSQQPGPLVSFGENMIDKGHVQLLVFADAFIGKNSCLTDVIPGILYGITNDFSFFFNVPFSPGNRDRDNHSSGLEDIFAQLEYAFYTKKSSYSADQATIVANGSFPTGSSSKIPPTGFGSYSFFIGATFNHMTIDWFVFTSPGAILTTSRHGTKFGNQFLYEFGFGRHIPSPSGWLFAWMVEFNGLYSSKTKMKGVVNPNSGGNVVYVTPSIWISSKRIVLQFGAGYPFVQHLFGNQSKKFLSFDFNFGITF